MSPYNVRQDLSGEAEGADGPVLPAPAAPMKVAREFVGTNYTHHDGLTLRHWRGGWWEWHTTHWTEIEPRAIRAAAYEFTEHAVYWAGKGGKDAKPWTPTSTKIADLIDALAAVVHLPESAASPSWLDGRQTGVIVACANGLLDVATRELLPHSPQFFNQVAVPFPFDPDGLDPERWLGFLESLWGDDAQSRRALAEWFGYVLSGRTSLQKILLMVGPTRGGKGAIARTLAELVGRENVAGPTLSSLGGDFGLAPMIGKPLAVVSDARLNGRDQSVVVERLLSVSGEDRLTVNRKYRDQWTGTLPSRFMLLSNELPQLGDASAAIAGRFVTLLLTESWLGKEDHALEPEIRRELPGILNWALDGLARLEREGRFTRPTGADEAYKSLVDLASPVQAFIRDRCNVGPDLEVAIDLFYSAWKEWAEDNGHARKTKQTLGRDLRAALPQLQVVQLRDGEERERAYRGVALAADPKPAQGSP
jgi:putative DNA primase/helicase